jgi:hypothetical protein
MFSGVRVARSRRILKASRTVGWSAIAPLRLQPDEARRRRQAAAEARRARARGRSHELQFIGTGGAWVLLGTAAASVGLFSWLIGSGGVGGGGLLPMSGFTELWRNAAYGWRTSARASSAPPTRSHGVLAVPRLVSRSGRRRPRWCWLWSAAMHAARSRSWFAASRLTERGSLAVRAVAALLWVPHRPFLTAIFSPRACPGAVVRRTCCSAGLVSAVFGAATFLAAGGHRLAAVAAVIAAARASPPALCGAGSWRSP